MLRVNIVLLLVLCKRNLLFWLLQPEWRHLRLDKYLTLVPMANLILGYLYSKLKLDLLVRNFESVFFIFVVVLIKVNILVPIASRT